MVERTGVGEGGSWGPRYCEARFSIAIIVPVRGRESQVWGSDSTENDPFYFSYSSLAQIGKRLVFIHFFLLFKVIDGIIS